MLLEKTIHEALKILLISHTSNPFDERYADEEGKGCDVEIPSSEGIIGIEAKNNNGKYGMSPYWLNRECHSRFEPTHVVKIFLCAFLTISNRTAEKMTKMGYHLIELGFQVTRFNFQHAIQTLTEKLDWISNLISLHTIPNQIPMSNRESQSTTSLSIITSVTTNSNINVSITKIQTFKDWKCRNLWNLLKKLFFFPRKNPINFNIHN